MSPRVLVKFSIDECICGINADIDGASPLINDIHGLNVTTISPNSETVLNLSLICSIDNFALPILSLTFLISINSVAYVLAFDSFRVNFASTIFLKICSWLCFNLLWACSSRKICCSIFFPAPSILFFNAASGFTLFRNFCDKFMLFLTSRQFLPI